MRVHGVVVDVMGNYIVRQVDVDAFAVLGTDVVASVAKAMARHK